mgnify:CR=1 FL=1
MKKKKKYVSNVLKVTAFLQVCNVMVQLNVQMGLMNKIVQLKKTLVGFDVLKATVSAHN